MAVKRIMPIVASESVVEARDFYVGLFGLDVVMDLGWIATLASDTVAGPQISVASEGGSGTPMPDVSIEVEDVDAVYAQATRLGLEIKYNLTDEPWGVRRFYLRDPAGKLLNLLAHLDGADLGR